MLLLAYLGQIGKETGNAIVGMTRVPDGGLVAGD